MFSRLGFNVQLWLWGWASWNAENYPTLPQAYLGCVFTLKVVGELVLMFVSSELAKEEGEKNVWP
jgi:hypothetical protein